MEALSNSAAVVSCPECETKNTVDTDYVTWRCSECGYHFEVQILLS